MRGRQHAYALVHDWLGEPAPVDRDAALAELARRYLAGHGPADDRDLAKWAGLPLRDVRAGLARHRIGTGAAGGWAGRTASGARRRPARSRRRDSWARTTRSSSGGPHASPCSGHTRRRSRPTASFARWRWSTAARRHVDMPGGEVDIEPFEPLKRADARSAGGRGGGRGALPWKHDQGRGRRFVIRPLSPPVCLPRPHPPPHQRPHDPERQEREAVQRHGHDRRRWC